jgi:hypothetical protein
MFKLKILIAGVLYGLLSACSPQQSPIQYAQPVQQVQPEVVYTTPQVVHDSSTNSMLLGGMAGYMLGRNSGGGSSPTPVPAYHVPVPVNHTIVNKTIVNNYSRPNRRK